MNSIAMSHAAEIDRVIRTYPWMDCELYAWIRGDVTIIAGIDLHGPAPDLLLHFEDVLFVVAPREWKSDTSGVVFAVLDGDSDAKMRQEYRVGTDHTIFQMITTDCDVPCRIAARTVRMVQQRPDAAPLWHPTSWADVKR